MRRTILVMGLSLFLAPFYLVAQVGIETTDPIASLDVNGNVRIAETLEGTTEAAKDSILIVDGNGIVHRTSAEEIYRAYVSNHSYVAGSLRDDGTHVVYLTISLGGGSKRIPFNSTDIDEYDNFDTTNYQFVAPYEGIYEASVQFTLNSLAGLGDIGLAIIKETVVPNLPLQESNTLMFRCLVLT